MAIVHDSGDGVRTDLPGRADLERALREAEDEVMPEAPGAAAPESPAPPAQKRLAELQEVTWADSRSSDAAEEPPAQGWADRALAWWRRR